MQEKRAEQLQSAQRIAEAQQVFGNYPDAVPKELQARVLDQQVALGMDPYMARLAGGPCVFKIVADRTKWPSGGDPYAVMDAQSRYPDASQIRLTFQNKTQYKTETVVKFDVVFMSGRVCSIEAKSESTNKSE